MDRLANLSAREAGEWLSAQSVDWNHFPLVTHAEAIMDVDPLVLASGHSNSGAELRAGGSFKSFTTTPTGPSIFVDGDLVVDGPMINAGLLLVRGDLIARAIATR